MHELTHLPACITWNSSGLAAEEAGWCF